MGDERVVYCDGCSLVTGESPDTGLGEWVPCPACGSRLRVVRGPGVRISLRSRVEKKPGQRRRPVESKAADELSADGRWVRVHRVIDRRRNSYYEKVQDVETREVLHETSHPLSEHRGHGDAKRRRGTAD